MLSLKQRLLLVSSLVLTLFLGLAGWSVDRAAQQRARTALEARLLSQAYAILGAAEENAEGLPRMPEQLSDPLLQQPDSGLYAQVSGQDDIYHWKSLSMLGRELSVATDGTVGEPQFLESNGLLLVDLLIEWEALDEGVYLYHITVAYDLQTQVEETAEFRRVLWQWLASTGILLLIAQILLLRWGLQPVNGLAQDVVALEAGSRQKLSRDVPVELVGLRDNLNSLVMRNRELLERNRNRLADLAHSLKTPLSVLTASAEDEDQQQLSRDVAQQLPRMRELVDYHLARASVSGGGLLGETVDVGAEITAIVGALKKVHQARNVDVQLNLPDELLCRIDKGDFYELAGNLLENAFKYCNNTVIVAATGGASSFLLAIEDDGPGVSSQQFSQLMQRGVRADQQKPGQGIGLSIVQEVVTAYQGEIRVDKGTLGGSRFEVRLHC